MLNHDSLSGTISNRLTDVVPNVCVCVCVFANLYETSVGLNNFSETYFRDEHFRLLD